MTTKIHTQYKTKEGLSVYGVTTIIGILDKPALINWAWKLGCQGIDYKKMRDKAASIGTIAHYMCECEMQGIKPDLSMYSQDDISKADNSFLAFLEFKKQNKLEPINNELQLVHDKLLFGGTIDFYGKLNDKLVLLDFKTGSGLYPEMRLQVAAYQELLKHNGYAVEEVHLLRIDKETGEFHHYKLSNLDREFEAFKLLLEFYVLWKTIKKEI